MSSKETGPRLFWARNHKGWTHRELADRARVAVGTISGLENGKHVPKTTIIERLASALDVAPCWLAYGDQDKVPDWWGEASEEGRQLRKRKQPARPRAAKEEAAAKPAAAGHHPRS